MIGNGLTGKKVIAAIMIWLAVRVLPAVRNAPIWRGSCTTTWSLRPLTCSSGDELGFFRRSGNPVSRQRSRSSAEARFERRASGTEAHAACGIMKEDEVKHLTACSWLIASFRPRRAELRLGLI